MDRSALRCACAPGTVRDRSASCWSVVLGPGRRLSGIGSAAEDPQGLRRVARQERASASSVASQFALRMDNVDGNDFDGYIKGINELLTTKAKTKNQKTFDAMKQSYEAAKVKGTGKVLLTRGG